MIIIIPELTAEQFSEALRTATPADPDAVQRAQTGGAARPRCRDLSHLDGDSVTAHRGPAQHLTWRRRLFLAWRARRQAPHGLLLRDLEVVRRPGCTLSALDPVCDEPPRVRTDLPLLRAHGVAVRRRISRPRRER